MVPVLLDIVVCVSDPQILTLSTEKLFNSLLYPLGFT